MPRPTRTLLALAALCAAGPALAACGTYEDGIEIGTIANTVVRYYRGIENRDCAAVTAELTPERAATLDCEQLIESWEGLGSADVSYRGPRTTRIKGSTAIVDARIRRQPERAGCTMGALGDSEATHRLVLVDGAWRISDVVVRCD